MLNSTNLSSINPTTTNPFSNSPTGFTTMKIADPLTDDTQVMATRDMAEVVCYRCHNPGHFAHQCYANKTLEGEPLPSSTKEDGRNNRYDGKMSSQSYKKSTPRRTPRDSTKSTSKSPIKSRVTRSSRRTRETRAHVTQDDQDNDPSDGYDSTETSDAEDADSDDDPMTSYLTRASQHDE